VSTIDVNSQCGRPASTRCEFTRPVSTRCEFTMWIHCEH